MQFVIVVFPGHTNREGHFFRTVTLQHYQLPEKERVIKPFKHDKTNNNSLLNIINMAYRLEKFL